MTDNLPEDLPQEPAADDLPALFWDPPETLSDEMRVIADVLTTRMRAEAERAPAPFFETIQSMQIERLVMFYAWIRHTERTPGGFRYEKNHREAIQAWMTMASGLAGDVTKAVTADAVKSMVMETVASTINGVLDTMHPDVADGLRNRFAEAFAEATL